MPVKARRSRSIPTRFRNPRSETRSAPLFGSSFRSALYAFESNIKVLRSLCHPRRCDSQSLLDLIPPSRSSYALPELFCSARHGFSCIPHASPQHPSCSITSMTCKFQGLQKCAGPRIVRTVRTFSSVTSGTRSFDAPPRKTAPPCWERLRLDVGETHRVGRHRYLRLQSLSGFQSNFHRRGKSD